jgi:hypothetical protein
MRPLTTRWNGPGILRQEQETREMRVPRGEIEGANPGRSLVPAAQAQAARSRYTAFSPTLSLSNVPISEITVLSARSLLLVVRFRHLATQSLEATNARH